MRWFANVYNFDFTGGQQTFTVPVTGYYKLEAWGAQGGQAYNTAYRGGYGGYSTGVYKASKNEIMYINVGGKGTDASGIDIQINGGYNGGGDNGIGGGGNSMTGAGGGATHIAKISGQLKNISVHATNGNILIVAGAGGGASYASCCGYVAGANGGGYVGINGKIGRGSIGTDYPGGCGGTQTESPTAIEKVCANCNKNNEGFGKGGGGGVIKGECFGGGGGSGYYGGTQGNGSAGGGGSGYIGSSNLISSSTISKHMACYSCTSSSAASTRTNSNTNVSAMAIADYSKIGNGYARITYLGTSI